MPAADLARGKNYQALGFPQGFETLTGMAGQLATLAVYGLPDTFFNEYVPKIQAVTIADAQAAARKYVQPDKFAIVDKYIKEMGSTVLPELSWAKLKPDMIKAYASTFTDRVIIATRSDLASAICGAIGAMKGPLHGGAPAEVIGQLGEIGSIDRAEDWARGKLARSSVA